VNPEYITGAADGTHSDHCEKNADRTKNSLAGVTLEICFARFMASMATFSNERASSRPFCRREPASMIESRDGCEKRCCREAVRKGLGHITDQRPFRHSAPRANRMFDEGDRIRGRSCNVIDQLCTCASSSNARGRSLKHPRILQPRVRCQIRRLRPRGQLTKLNAASAGAIPDTPARFNQGFDDRATRRLRRPTPSAVGT